MRQRQLLQIYERLHKQFGPQHWWPVIGPSSLDKLGITNMGRFEIMVGAILTQNTAWLNVEKAIVNLVNANALNPKKIVAMPSTNLERLIRPAGYFRQKTRKLKIFSKWYLRNHRAFAHRKTEDIRKELLSLWGIGPETADSMLLYALGRPVFVVDAYTRRLCESFGIGSRRLQPASSLKAAQPKGCGYHEIQKFFTDELPRSAKIYNEFHALIVAWGKTRSLDLARDDKYGRTT